MSFNLSSIEQRHCASRMKTSGVFQSPIALLLARAKTDSAPTRMQHVIGLIDDPPIDLPAYLYQPIFRVRVVSHLNETTFPACFGVIGLLEAVLEAMRTLQRTLAAFRISQ